MFFVNHQYAPSYSQAQYLTLRGSNLSPYSNADMLDYGLLHSRAPLGSLYLQHGPHHPDLDLDLDLEYVMLEERRIQIQAAREGAEAQKQARQSTLYAREQQRLAYARELAARQAAEEEKAYRAHIARARLHQLDELRRQEEQHRIVEGRRLGHTQPQRHVLQDDLTSPGHGRMFDDDLLGMDMTSPVYGRRQPSRTTPQPSRMGRHPASSLSEFAEMLKMTSRPAPSNLHSHWHTEPTVETQFIPPYFASTTKAPKASLDASSADLSGLIHTGLAAFLGQHGHQEQVQQERSLPASSPASANIGSLVDLINVFVPKSEQDVDHRPATQSTDTTEFDLGQSLEHAFAAFFNAQTDPVNGASVQPNTQPSAGPSTSAGPASRIPFSDKGKWRAADFTSPAFPTANAENNDQVSAQLAADAAFAAALQAEEDAIAARADARARGPSCSNRGVHFAEPGSCPTFKRQSKPEVDVKTDTKNPISLEDLFRAWVANMDEVDNDILVTVNRLLQLLSPTTSPTKQTTAKTGTPASTPSVGPSASTILPPRVPIPVVQHSKPTAHEILDGISSSFGDLRSGFILPALEFTRPASPSATSTWSSGLSHNLAFTPANRAVHEYEASLGKLLDQLDAVESDGDDNVRVRRKELVKQVEAALSDMEQAVDVQHREQMGNKAEQIDDVKVEEHQEVHHYEEDEEAQGYDAVPVVQASPVDEDTTSTSVEDLLVDLSHDDKAANMDQDVDQQNNTSSGNLVSTFSISTPPVLETTGYPTVDTELPREAEEPLTSSSTEPSDHVLSTADAPRRLTEVLNVPDSSRSSLLALSVDAEDVNNMLPLADRVPSLVFEPIHADSDEEAVLNLEDGEASEHTESEAGWSQVDGSTR